MSIGPSTNRLDRMVLLMKHRFKKFRGMQLSEGRAMRKLPMWHLYRVELYPHVGQIAGILDIFGNETDFPSAFRQSRRGCLQKGILVLQKG